MSTNDTRPTPAPGALPELIESRLRYLERFSDEGQHKSIPGPYAGPAWELAQDLRMAIPAYARAYAEQCRAGVWLPIESAPDGDCLEFPIWVAWNNGRVDYVDECACVDYTGCIGWMKVTPPSPPALQSAFADDEGVKNER